MTHTTDQERAEFEKWWSSPHIWGRGHKEAQWASWQAARRAPAAPVPQGWKLVPSESTEEMARAFRANDAPHYFVMTTMRCNDFAERYRAAISAAPQPPEAASMISSREIVSKPGSGVTVTRLNLSDVGRAALQSKANHIEDAAPQPPEAAQSNSAEFEGIKPDAFQTEGGCPVSNAETVAIAALEKVLRAIQRHLPPERIGERETIAEIISIVDPWPLGNLPAPWKDHRTAALVNELRDCAAKYGQTQQLRERIAYIVAPLCAQLKAAEQAAVNQQLTTETAPVQLPENLREGEPYDNPAFEALARALGVWGTAQSAVCAQFWIAAKEQST